MVTAVQPKEYRGELETRPHVLIIDDDAVVRMILEDICTEFGWSVAVAGNSGDALLTAGFRRPDLVLLDFNLGKSTALGLVGNLHTVAPMTPIVVLTGQTPEEVRGAVIEAGGTSVIGKPCSVAEVVSVLGHYRPTLAGTDGALQ
jgi:DNA-binding response OmpR family regulator